MVDKKVKPTKWNSKEKPCLKCGTSSNWHSHRSHCWSAHQICGKCSMKNFECNLCRTHSPILGKKLPVFTKEHCDNISKARKGGTSWLKGLTKETDERVRKISENRKGIIFTKEHREKIGKSKKGSIPWNKGKTDVYSSETLELMSKCKIGKPNGTKGRTHSLTARKLMSESKKILSKTGFVFGKPFEKGISPWCKGLTKETDLRLAKLSQTMMGRKMNKEWRDNLSKSRKGKPLSKEHIENIIKSVPYKDSKPERMMQIALTLNGIKFEKQKSFKLGTRWHPVDIFIEPNIVLEVDGVHFHIEYKQMKKDLFQTQELTIMGYHVIRIRDKDILKDANKCSEKVIKLIKELQYSRFSLNQNP